MPRRSPFKLSRQRLIALCLSSLLLCLGLGHRNIAQASQPHQLVEQGVEQYQQGHYIQAIQHWQTALTAYQNLQDRDRQATLLENLARAYQQTGQLDQTLQSWKQAIAIQTQLNHLPQVGRLLTEQAQTYNRLGQHRRAIALLCNSSPENSCQKGSALQLAQAHQDPQGAVAALGSLGETYRLLGEPDQAIQYLEQAKTIQQSTYQISILNSLGNAYLSQAQRWESWVRSAQVRGADYTAQTFQAKATQNYQQARQHYASSLQLAQAQKDTPAQLQALLNLIQLERNLLPLAEPASGSQPKLIHLLQTLPNSSAKIYAAINLVNLSSSPQKTSLSPTACPAGTQLDPNQTKIILEQAVQNAIQLQDTRAQSFALGVLGHFYECRQQFPQALNYTRKALWAADQQKVSQDSLYRWEWQTGRILEAQGNQNDAIAAYDRAYQILEQTRSEILGAKRDLQFDFRDNVEQLYRQLAQLKLEFASQQLPKSKNYSQTLTRALQTIDSLKIAELQNYFGFDCNLPTLSSNLETGQPQDFNPFNQIEPDTAVFVSIILPKRTAIIANIVGPNGRSQHLHWINRDREELVQNIGTFRKHLESASNFEIAYKKLYHISGKDLYDQIVAPFASQLKLAHVKTLVFIQDGLFRNIPMAALYDGQKYLVQDYAIATTPSLSLTQPSQKHVAKRSVLSLGVTQSTVFENETFAALPNVKTEVDQITSQFPGSIQLLDTQFTRANLQQILSKNRHSVVHIATHGQFGTIPEDSFLVVGNNQKITLSELERDFRTFSPSNRPIELLILSACQTALGDDRTTLGMAGLTVQAGVKSALASLWLINDSATQELVNKFTRDWEKGMNKAQALQEAQNTLIARGYHPVKWAPFVLIGNWQ
jgi:CHAT domain-containing protein